MLTKSRRVVGKTRSSRLGWADGPQDECQTQNVTHPFARGPSKIGGRVALRSSRLLDGRGIDKRVVELSLHTLASTAWRQAVDASVGRDMQDSRLACEDGELAAEPRRHLDRELRFNGASRHIRI